MLQEQNRFMKTHNLTLFIALKSAPTFSRNSDVVVRPPYAAKWRGVAPHCKVESQHCQFLTANSIISDAESDS